VKWRQQAEGIAELTEKQISILDGASRLVKFGGRLVYATCSLLDEENEGIAAQFLASHPDFELVPMHKVLLEQRIPLEMGDYLKMLPHKHGTDGFFAAVFERKAGDKPAKAAKVDAAADADAADAEE
jgi:16S rRNA (cytosine967-C5)-methyltransferase